MIELIRQQEAVFLQHNLFLYIRLAVFILFSCYSVYTDARKQEIPALPWIIIAAAATVSWIFIDLQALVYSLAGIAGLVAIFLLIYYLSGKKGIGLGDMVYLAAFSAMFGYLFSIFAFLFSFWSAALILALPLLLKKIDRQTRVPFVPFLFLGCLLSLALSLYY